MSGRSSRHARKPTVERNLYVKIFLKEDPFSAFEGFDDGSKVNSPKEAEARAILHTLKEATTQGFNKIQLLSNAYEVILAINGLMDWSIHPILLDIKDFSFKFEGISFAHILRNVNVFAHELAKMSYGSRSNLSLQEFLQPR